MSNWTGAEGLFRPLIKYVLPILAAVFCVSVAISSSADAAEQSAMVIDANTGKVLYSSKGDEQRYPASLTKMMTLYMAFELIEKGRLKYDDKISISAQAATQPPSKLGLDAGDTISVRNAVLALVTKSANDIAVAVAEHIAGSEANFARLMTRKAREIGMSKTTFRNASGLPDSEQVTTARDMITLALRLQDEFPEHYKLFATERFSFAGSNYRNHNTLLRSYRGTDGVKTGYTRASGFNLVSSVHRGSKHLVAAVFGGKTSGQRNATMHSILDRTFIKAATRRTRPRIEQPQLIAKPKSVDRPIKSALAPTKAPPLPRPAPAEKSSPDNWTDEEASAEVAAAPNAAQTAPPASPGEPPKTAELSNPATDDRISIARVRTVGVTEHFAERRAAAQLAREKKSHDETNAEGSKDTDSDSGPRSISELIASTAHTNSRTPAGLGRQHDGAITPTPGKEAPIALASPTESEPSVPQPSAPRQPAPQSSSPLSNAVEPSAAAAATSDETPGRAPSTLQDQLSQILADHRPEIMDREQSQPKARMQTASIFSSPQKETTRREAKPAKAGTAQAATTNGTHLIQIGAFNTADEAERQLQSIRERAKTVLASAAPITEPITQGQRRYFRARFAGFDSQGATTACQELRRRSIDCFVAKVQ